MIYHTHAITTSPHEANENSITLLAVEDEEGDFGLIQAHLHRAELGSGEPLGAVTWAKTLNEAIEAAQCASHDVILLDLTLPDSMGLNTVRQMRSAAPDTPIIVLTGTDDHDLAINALEAGAQDYLIKGEYAHDILGRAAYFAAS